MEVTHKPTSHYDVTSSQPGSDVERVAPPQHSLRYILTLFSDVMAHSNLVADSFIKNSFRPTLG